MSSPIDVKDVQILVAEDNKRTIQQIQNWLIHYGYQHITLTYSAKECIEKLSDQFDVILVDMRMETDDSGFTILDAIQERSLNSAVIILTANATTTDKRQAYRSDVWKYISKSAPGNVFDTVNDSIRGALIHRRDKMWLEGHMSELREKYPGQYVAVLNESVVEAANSHNGLNKCIQMHYPPLIPSLIQKIDAPLAEPLQAELTVFVEGPTDVKYIQCAAKLLGKEALLDRIHLDAIGNQDGQKGSGYQGLNQGFETLRNNPHLHPYKVLFLFDQDVNDKQIANKGEDFENLFVRRIADLDPDKKGIEYLLTQKIHEEGFDHDLEFIQKDLGRVTRSNPNPVPTYIIKEQSKMKLCKWICDERANQAEEFTAFQPIFNLFESLLDDNYGMA